MILNAFETSFINQRPNKIAPLTQNYSEYQVRWYIVDSFPSLQFNTWLAWFMSDCKTRFLYYRDWKKWDILKYSRRWGGSDSFKLSCNYYEPHIHLSRFQMVKGNNILQPYCNICCFLNGNISNHLKVTHESAWITFLTNFTIVAGRLQNIFSYCPV